MFNNNTVVTELVFVHDFEIMSGFIVLACLAILNGNFWAAVYIKQSFVVDDFSRH